MAAAVITVQYEAGQHTLELLGALQHADSTAIAARTKIALASSELGRLALQEAPPKALRDLGLVPGQATDGAIQPGSAAGTDPLSTMAQLEQGIPVTTTSPDGKTTTITPNPDGTMTVAQSLHGPDGSTITTSTTGDGPPTTTMTKTRPDGSGIIDSTITGPDGKPQRLQTIPKGEGKSATHAVNEDGSLGTKISESYPAPNGGVITDMPGPSGELDREWRRPDGFRSFEQYVTGPDGQQHLAGTSNSAGMHSEVGQDGTINTTFSDGRTAQTGQLADGRVVTKFEDGSVLSYDPDKAIPGSPKQSPWEVVKTWTGGQWEGLYSSTESTVASHPYATGAGLGASAVSEWTARSGNSMADQAAASAGRSAESSARAFQLLDTGTPGAGRAMVDSIDAAADAAAKGSTADILKNAGKYGGWAATAGINSYVNWDDWAHNGKPGDEAIANAVGGTAGGIGGAWLGAWGGAALCAPIAPPIGSAFCAGAGAALGGLGGGAAGAYFAEQPFK